jgi:hypothetical protein
MIRDPSDGTVREVPKAEMVSAKPRPSPDTGVRQPTKTDAMQRLEFSREWLKNYHAKKETAHARGSNDTEHSTDGRAVNDQGEGQPGLSELDGTDSGADREG